MRSSKSNTYVVINTANNYLSNRKNLQLPRFFFSGCSRLISNLVIIKGIFMLLLPFVKT